MTLLERVSNNRFDNINHLCNWISKSQNIRAISISGNKMSTEETVEIFTTLQTNTSITSVKFNHNKNIGLDGIRAIVSALKVNKTITQISLVGNNLCDQGAILIADAIVGNQVLQSISLVGNNIGPDGACVLFNALQKSTSMQYISLACNNVGKEGVIAQVECLKEREGVSHVQLSNNCLDDDTGAYIAGILKGNTSIKSVDVTNNPDLSAQTVVKIGQAIMTNTDVEDINAAIKSSFSNQFLTEIIAEQGRCVRGYECTILGIDDLDPIGTDFFD